MHRRRWRVMKGREFFGPKIAGLFVQKIAQKNWIFKVVWPKLWWWSRVESFEHYESMTARAKNGWTVVWPDWAILKVLGDIICNKSCPNYWQFCAILKNLTLMLKLLWLLSPTSGHTESMIILRQKIVAYSLQGFYTFLPVVTTFWLLWL